MESKQPKTDGVTDPRAKIMDGFRLYVLEDGHVPPSVYQLAQILQIEEKDFYEHFSSFGAIQSAFWVEMFEKTVEDLHAQTVYAQYSAREKLLAFFFTWIEELKKNRSYLLALYDKKEAVKFPPPEVRAFKEKFTEFVRVVLAEGEEAGEVAKRPLITNRYHEGVWFQVWFIFKFWINDTSASFEKTDAAIEKSVHLAFDLIGKNALDSIIDFARFFYQNK